MTHKEAILDAFRKNNGSMTLGYILGHPWGYEARARFSELRREGFFIVLEKGKRPSDNLYRLVEPEGSQMRFA